MASNNRFKVGQQTDPIDFLQWFLNFCNKELQASTRQKMSIVTQTFQGKVKTNTFHKDTKDAVPIGAAIQQQSPFLFLTLDIPPAPLFKDDFETVLIPQVNLLQLLSKYDGKTETVYKLQIILTL